MDARLLADPDATGNPEWESYLTGAAELTAEYWRRMRSLYPEYPERR